MRNEKEVLDLIKSIADSDKRIRAVYLGGSRVNPKINKDIYCDYDVVYVVTETNCFIEDKQWLLDFGKPLIIQEPDSNDLGWSSSNDITKHYTWLMLFDDGVRIDLTIETKEEALKNYNSEAMVLSLLDKDDILPAVAKPSDKGYWIKSPTEEIYYGCCNEFWWCLNNVAKAVARDQMPYALSMYNEIVHKQLEKMTEWYIGSSNNFKVSTGMWGKYFKKYLPANLYEMYLNTYSDSNKDNLWSAIFTSCDLFHILAIEVAKTCGFTYKQHEEDGMIEYLSRF